MNTENFAARHERGLKTLLFFSFVLLFWMALLASGQGFEQAEKENACYSRVTVCHGIPTKSCVGIQTERVESRECQYTEQIKTLCRDQRRQACVNGTKPNSTIMGRSCEFWRDAMDMEKRSCSDFS